MELNTYMASEAAERWDDNRLRVFCDGMITGSMDFYFSKEN
jgi:hypothetical protein